MFLSCSPATHSAQDSPLPQTTDSAPDTQSFINKSTGSHTVHPDSTTSQQKSDKGFNKREASSSQEINHFCGDQEPFQVASCGWTDSHYLRAATSKAPLWTDGQTSGSVHLSQQVPPIPLFRWGNQGQVQIIAYPPGKSTGRLENLYLGCFHIFHNLVLLIVRNNGQKLPEM